MQSIVSYFVVIICRILDQREQISNQTAIKEHEEHASVCGELLSVDLLGSKQLSGKRTSGAKDSCPS